MVSQLLTFSLYLLLIATFVQTKSPLRLGLNYLEDKALEEADFLQSEAKSLLGRNAEKDIPDVSTNSSIMEATRADETSDLKEINKEATEEKAVSDFTEKLNSNDETQEKEKVEPNKREVLAGDDNSNTGGEILHILVLIVIVLAGIGAVIAIIAFIAFLVNYIKRRINIKEGKRPGSEDILLLDNSHLPTMGSV